MYCNLSATALRLKNSCNQCAIQNAFFGCRSIGDWSTTTIPKIGDQSATGGRLIANWLEMGCDWSATGWRLVGDRSAMGWWLTTDQTICCVGVIMNKALTNCTNMVISISIMPYCLFLCYFNLKATSWRQFYKRYFNHQSLKLTWKKITYLIFLSNFSGANEFDYRHVKCFFKS